MNAALTPGFVLHRRPYRNTSALLEVLTATEGRVGLVARGVSRPKSRLAGALQPFVPLMLGWSGRGELGTLTQAEAVSAGYRLPPSRLALGLYLNELIVKLLGRHDSVPDLFASYQTTLQALSLASPAAVALRRFERQLLATLGLGLILDRDSTGATLSPGASYRYDPEAGPVKLKRGETALGAVSGRGLLAFARDELDDAEVLRDALSVTRSALDHQLGGRVLKSRELLRRISRPQARAPIQKPPPRPAPDN